MSSSDPLLSRATLIEVFLAVVLLIVSFAAIAASDVSAPSSRNYWTALVIVYALAALVVEHVYSGRPWTDARNAMNIAAHWFAVFCAIQLVYFFVSSGRMNNADMGLSNGLILALGTLLGGIHGNWRLIVFGIASGVATAGVAFIEQYLWFLGGVVILAGAAMIVGGRVIRGVKQSVSSRD